MTNREIGKSDRDEREVAIKPNKTKKK